MPDVIVYDVFQALYEAWVEHQEAPERFVGLQGDRIVIVGKGGAKYVVLVEQAA